MKSTCSASPLSKLGFDLPKLRFAAQTAFAASVALVIAWLLGLEHPQWAAMTVWATSQPTRGQLLEKGLFRAGGTFVGVAAGILLVLLFSSSPLGMVIGLAIWVAGCVAAGNILRGLTSYCAMLAAYSASMVALLDIGHPDHVFALGLDRLGTILTGVVASVVIGWIFTPESGEAEIVGRMRHMTANLLRALALRVRNGGAKQLTPAEERILADMALADEQFDPHAAGSLRRRQSTRAMRSILSAQIALLLSARSLSEGSDIEIAAALEDAASLLEGGEDSALAIERINLAAAKINHFPDLAEALHGLGNAITAFRSARFEKPVPLPTAFSPVLHRDWHGARQSAVRAFVSLMLVGLAWSLTGWHPLAFLMLGLSIMTTIFSTFDNPAGLMRFVMKGQFLGALGALVCNFVVWPFADNTFQLVLMMIPFIFASALLFAHKRTAVLGFDYAMVSLLLLQPHLPLTLDLAGWIPNAAAVVAAPVVAFFVFKGIYPVDAKRRLNALIRMAVDEVAMLARAEDALDHRLVWRARLHHRLLRMVCYAERSGMPVHEVAEGALAVLSLGKAVMELQMILRSERATPAERRVALAALARLQRLDREPAKAAVALNRAARRVGAGWLPSLRLLSDANDALTQHKVFLTAAR